MGRKINHHFFSFHILSQILNLIKQKRKNLELSQQKIWEILKCFEDYIYTIFKSEQNRQTIHLSIAIYSNLTQKQNQSIHFNKFTIYCDQ